MTRVAFTTLGCKSNHYDTECLIEACRSNGYEIVSFDECADAYVINTCTVTMLADAESRQLMRRAKRRSSTARVIAIGCSTQNDAATYRAIGEVDAVFGVRCVEEVLGYLNKAVDHRPRKPGSGTQHFPPENVVARPQARPMVPTQQSRARALLKIQDGCDHRCTYCAVWRARGPSVSVPSDEVLQGFAALKEYPEVMLTGIHVGQYGRDCAPNIGFAHLVHTLAESKGPRVRIGSLNPDELDDKLCALFRHPQVCRHLHLSLQSGAPRVLAAMGRTYTPDHVAASIAGLVTRVPGMAVGMDVIAGFPGETLEDHRATVAFISALPVALLHVFPYSPRPGTPAAAMPQQVPQVERKRRAQELLAVGRAKRSSFATRQIGTEAFAVVTARAPDAEGYVTAVTDNYVTMRLCGDGSEYGTGGRVRLTAMAGEEVRGLWI